LEDKDMFSEELKALRSNFLVHWTGAKDIEKEPNLDPEAKSRKYLYRLKELLKKAYG
jgi:hypothetical protein